MTTTTKLPNGTKILRTYRKSQDRFALTMRMKVKGMPVLQVAHVEILHCELREDRLGQRFYYVTYRTVGGPDGALFSRSGSVRLPADGRPGEWGAQSLVRL